MTKVSIEELKQRFGPPMNVTPHGECLVIQGPDFDPDWEVYLSDQGYKCINDMLDGHPVTFVQLKKAEKQRKSGGEKKMDSKKSKKSPFWTTEQDTLLVKTIGKCTYGRNRLVAAAVKAGKFPGRTVEACMQRYDKIPKAFKEKVLSEEKQPQPRKDNVTDTKVAAEAPIASFDEIWSISRELGTDLKQRAEAFYNAAVEAKLPKEIICSVISVFCEVDGLRDYYDNTLGEQEKFDGTLKKEVESLAEKLLKHKHADKTGEAMQPLEVSR